MIAPFSLEGLQSYSRAEVKLWNWTARALRAPAEWRAWMGESIGGFLERPDGFEASLVQTHCLERDQPPKPYPLRKAETTLGRNPECDVVLPAQAVGKQHARIVARENQYVLEDLGSTLGTFVEKAKLTAGSAHVLQPGDSFTIFPYRLELRVERKWAPETRIEISDAHLESTTWADFDCTAATGWEHCAVSVHPIGGVAHLALSRAFLEQVLERLVGVARTERPDEAALVQSDRGVFEFLLLSLLDRASRGLSFPFQFVPVFGPPLSLPGKTAGIAMSSTIGLTDLAGAVRAFLPYDVIEQMEQAALPRPSIAPPQVSWRLPVVAGSVELTYEEMSRLESGDILLFDPKPALLLPNNPDRGWKCTIANDNPWRLRIDNYNERSVRMDSADSPDLSGLPLRLDVLLGERELTLGEINGLAPGTIIELDATKSDPVWLSVNGKVVGEGELVEIDGKLGVKVLSWSLT